MRLAAAPLLLLLALGAASSHSASTTGDDADDACGDVAGDAGGAGFPLRLLATGARGEVFVCPAAVAFLRDVVGERAVAIASVVGNARIGKSFLTNHLLGRAQTGAGAFVVGHGASSVTKGAWLAPAPAPLPTPAPAPVPAPEGANGSASVEAAAAEAAALAAGDAAVPSAASAPPAADAAPLQLLLDVEGFSDGEALDAEASDPVLCTIASTISALMLFVVDGTPKEEHVRFLSTTAQLHDALAQRAAGALMPSAELTWVSLGKAVRARARGRARRKAPALPCCDGAIWLLERSLTPRPAPPLSDPPPPPPSILSLCAALAL